MKRRSNLSRIDHRTVLSGPCRDPSCVVISEIFGKSLSSALVDASRLQVHAHDSHRFQDHTIFRISSGYFAVHIDGCLSGIFTGCDLSVAVAFRNRGLGRYLVQKRLLDDDWLPTWDHDEPGYSPEGARCVIKAYATLQT